MQCQNVLQRHLHKRHEELEQKLGRRLEFTSSKEYYLLKNYKWLILKNQDNINYPGKTVYNYKLRRYVNIAQIEKMLFDIDYDLKYIRDLKEKYISFNRKIGNNYNAAKLELRKLIQLYRECPYPMFHEIADTLSYHFESIVNSFIMVERFCCDGIHISRLSNGPVEALNQIAKDLKRNGHGYRNFEHLRNRFLFSQRKNAHVLATPRSLDEVCSKTGIIRGPYKK